MGKDMQGKVLKKAIRENFFEAHPLQKIPTYSSEWKYSSSPVKSKMDKVLKEKLKALGYIN